MEEDPLLSTQYPPGIRFHPSDEELISYYLERKVKSLPLPPNVITDIDLYHYNPWDLPRKTMFGEDEWYFFTPRDRKYPKGGRPNRTAASGYWKATGTDKPIMSTCGSRKIGVKKGLIFYQGKPPSGHKMDWSMTEYRLPDSSRPSRLTTGSMRLDDWVLCRIRQKGNMSKNELQEDNSCEFHHSKIKNNPPSVCVHESRDVMFDYMQSSEHQTVVSFLVGHDPTGSRTFFQSQKSGTICDHDEQEAATKSCSYVTSGYINLEECFDLPALEECFLECSKKLP